MAQKCQGKFAKLALLIQIEPFGWLDMSLSQLLTNILRKEREKKKKCVDLKALFGKRRQHSMTVLKKMQAIFSFYQNLLCVWLSTNGELHDRITFSSTNTLNFILHSINLAKVRKTLVCVVLVFYSWLHICCLFTLHACCQVFPWFYCVAGVFMVQQVLLAAMLCSNRGRVSWAIYKGKNLSHMAPVMWASWKIHLNAHTAWHTLTVCTEASI